MAFSVFVLIIVTIVVLSFVADAARQVMEPDVSYNIAPRFWTRVAGSLSSNDIVSCVFVLKHDSHAMKSFEQNLIDISTPTSKNYGKFLSVDEIKDLIAPSSEKVDAVLKFLASFGVTGENARVSKVNDMVHARVPATVAAEMLGTEFAKFTSTKSSKINLIRATKPYSLPSEIAEIVNLVDDIVRFPSVRSDSPLKPAASSSTAAESPVLTSDAEFAACGTKCSTNTNPSVLAKAYSFSYPVQNVNSKNSVSVAEFQYQYWDNKDLTAFGTQCGVNVAVNNTVGPNKEAYCETTGCVEALLDIEYIGSIVYPIPLTVIYQDEYSLLKWVDSVISLTNPPLVHSVSYGNDEIQQTSVDYMNSVNEQFMVTGSLGLSILFASGDQGVWGRTGVSSTFNPDFPASSPYVTSVGGTDFKIYGTIGEETVWNCGGGGFSNTFPQPSWQAEAVSYYFKQASRAGNLPPSTMYNATGRGYPDISALGGQINPYCVSIHGGSKFEGVAGTSASCPVVAGIFGQVNNDRLNRGLSPMGWLNPFIYANTQCFNDVHDGTQNNCYKGSVGFATVTGWDPATGNGSPIYSCLKDAALRYHA